MHPLNSVYYDEQLTQSDFLHCAGSVGPVRASSHNDISDLGNNRLSDHLGSLDNLADLVHVNTLAAINKYVLNFFIQT
jgi:hypothetical protein